MLESESEIMERIYGINILREDDIVLLKKKRKLKEVIENLNISDHLSAKSKKYIILGLELFIIAAHIAFFILRIFNF
ncbi:MAG: hypothetical protein ACFE8M_13060 [Candidatus Hermodarchaeota archaeon]